MSINGYDITCFRIAGFLPALSDPYLKRTEATELDDSIALQSVFDFLKELVDNLMDFKLIHAKFFIDVLNESKKNIAAEFDSQGLPGTEMIEAIAQWAAE